MIFIMKVNKIYSLWLMLSIIYFTLYNSLRILCRTFLGKCERKYVNFIAISWSVKLLKILKTSYTIHNPLNVKLEEGQSYILMSNHASHFDIPLIFVTFPNNSVRMMTKKELFKFPIWVNCLKCSEFISIDRNNRKQAAMDLKVAQEKMKTGIIPWIAPEGTRSKDGKLQPFKKGGFMLALQTKATIIPVGIRGSKNILPAKTLDFSLREKIEIHIGKPIETINYSSKDLHKLLETVELSIKNLCNC